MAKDRVQPAAQPRRRRLVIVNSTLHIGGAEQVSAWLARGVDRQHFDVSACYLKEPGVIAEQMWRNGVRLAPVPGLVAGKKDYLSPIRLRRFIGSGRGTVIHTHDVHGLMAGSFCRLTMPSLRHVHTFHFGNYADVDPYRRSIERMYWRVPDALIAVGHSQRQSIERIYRVPEKRIRVIWNGVDDPDREHQSSDLGFSAPSGIPIIGSISTLIPQKGLHHLLEAAAILRQSGERFLLLIAGDGVLHDELAAYARELNLQCNIRFLGWIPQASRRLLPACDIFVQSSLWEAMSIVVLEAMAAGKAMVVTAVGDNKYAVIADESGLVIPPGRPEALAHALGQLIRDPLLRARLGSAARRRYETLFTVQHMISAHQQLYSEIMSSP